MSDYLPRRPRAFGVLTDDELREYYSSGPKLNTHQTAYIEYFTCKKEGCAGSANFNHTTQEFKFKKDHTCTNDVGLQVVDLEEIMKNRTEELAISNPAHTAIQIWNLIRKEFYGTPGVIVNGLKSKQVEKLVHWKRRKLFENIYQKIESEPLVSCGTIEVPDGRPFLQFNTVVSNKQKLERILGFGHPSLIWKARQKLGDWFIDGTFYVACKGFKQCVVVMLYDTDTELYTPIWYVLTQSKNELTYATILQLCITSSEGYFRPGTVTADFERPIHAAVLRIFAGVALIVGCLFHWKQAIRKHMIKVCKIDEVHVERMMKVGKLDILTIIPVEDIVKKGIPYLRYKFAAAEAMNPLKWKKFWDYFATTWMKLYDPLCWNISHLLAAGVELRNRTNNGCERHNRRLNALFSTPHPSVERFMTVVKEESHRYLDHGEAIRTRLAEPPVRHPVVAPKLPRDYASFEAGAVAVAEALLALAGPIVEVDSDDETEEENVSLTNELRAVGDDTAAVDTNEQDGDSDADINSTDANNAHNQWLRSDDSHAAIPAAAAENDASQSNAGGLGDHHRRPRSGGMDPLLAAVRHHADDVSESDEDYDHSVSVDATVVVHVSDLTSSSTEESAQQLSNKRVCVPSRKSVENRQQHVVDSGQVARIRALVKQRDKENRYVLMREVSRQKQDAPEAYAFAREPLKRNVDYSADTGVYGDLYRHEMWREGHVWQHDIHGRRPTKKELRREVKKGNADNGYLVSLVDCKQQYEAWCLRGERLRAAVCDTTDFSDWLQD